MVYTCVCISIDNTMAATNAITNCQAYDEVEPLVLLLSTDDEVVE